MPPFPKLFADIDLETRASIIVRRTAREIATACALDRSLLLCELKNVVKR